MSKLRISLIALVIISDLIFAYIGDEYAQTGVDATNITADAVYSFVKTVSE